MFYGMYITLCAKSYFSLPTGCNMNHTSSHQSEEKESDETRNIKYNP